MTDIQSEAELNTTPEQAEKTEPGPMKYKSGDELSVSRGKSAGRTATVLAVDKIKRQYAVQYTDGTVGTVNDVNVKAPAEGTITASELAQVMTNVTTLEDLVDILKASVDGFAKAYDPLG